MSTVQRKVFEQLKSFMVRITFNKKYIFAGLVKKPQAGRNSGKAQGQPCSSGEEPAGSGERPPHAALVHQRNREGMLGGFFSPLKLCVCLQSGRWARSQRCSFMLGKS